MLAYAFVTQIILYYINMICRLLFCIFIVVNSCTSQIRRQLKLLSIENGCTECEEALALCDTDHSWNTVYKIKELIKDAKLQPKVSYEHPVKRA